MKSFLKNFLQKVVFHKGSLKKNFLQIELIFFSSVFFFIKIFFFFGFLITLFFRPKQKRVTNHLQNLKKGNKFEKREDKIFQFL
jgi:hypothetical protein